MTTFGRTEYNRQYYLRHKEKLDQKRLDNYHKNKGLKTFNEYVNNLLDEDMTIIRDQLLKTDETDPKQIERCIELMKLVKLLLILKCAAIGDDKTEIERIKNIQVYSFD